ncbi:DMT family transporter [Terrarubrum flagellatum]|uniref:DMT family transporter n=1 Tax=Terrirubrum flagellatum TaxID=2895980 RepID=UPI00314540BE
MSVGRVAVLAGSIWARPYLLLPFPPLFWAVNLLIGRAFGAELPPIGLTFWRWVVASLCVLPFAWRELRAKRREIQNHWRLIFAMSAAAFAGYPVLNYLALQTTPAATAAVLNSTLPLMIPLIAWVVAGENPPPQAFVGIAVSCGGVLWIVCRGVPAQLLEIGVSSGEILLLLAVAGYALYSVLLRRRPKQLSDTALMAAMSVATVLIMLPLWIVDISLGRRFPIEIHTIVSLLFIGVFSSLLGAIVWNRCVATLGPTLTGASFHLMAVYSSLLAILLLGEPVRAFHIVGIALILLGLAATFLPDLRLRQAIASSKAGGGEPRLSPSGKAGHERI